MNSPTPPLASAPPSEARRDTAALSDGIAMPTDPAPQSPRGIGVVGQRPTGPGSVASARQARQNGAAPLRPEPLRDPRVQLAQLQTSVDQIRKSTEHTEAFLSIGLQKRLMEALSAEMGTQARLQAIIDRQTKRLHHARIAALALSAALVAMEVETGYVQTIVRAIIGR